MLFRSSVVAEADGRLVMARCMLTEAVTVIQISGYTRMLARATRLRRHLQWTGDLMVGSVYRAYGAARGSVNGDAVPLVIKRGSLGVALFHYYTRPGKLQHIEQLCGLGAWKVSGDELDLETTASVDADTSMLLSHEAIHPEGRRLKAD